MAQLPLFPLPVVEVAQHNNLIFAPFALGSIESKIFISMLERVDRNGEELPEWRIPITEILSRRDGDSYEQLKKAAYSLKAEIVDIAPVNPTYPARKQFKLRSIIDKCDHESGSGFLICQFHQDVKEYLLRMVGNYTKADLAVLKKFKDERSVRFYWMLKARFYNTDTVTITVEECRFTLLKRNSKSYQNPSDIKKHILDAVVKPELAKTDCAFEYGQPVKSGNKTLAWTFIKLIDATNVLPPTPIGLSDKLIKSLEIIPIDLKGIRRIAEAVGNSINNLLIDEGYVFFTIHRYQADKEQVKKSIGGAIIKAVETGKFAKEYQNYLKKHTQQSTLIKHSFAEVQSEHQRLLKNGLTQVEDLTIWAKMIYPEEEFERRKIDEVWYIVKRS